MDSFERARHARPIDPERTDAAYRRMSDAEALLVSRFEQQDGGSVRRDDPVRQLIRHPITPDNADPQLWLLGLGEKVAALGGHLELRAVFGDGELTLLREPGSEAQPPILQDRTTPPHQDQPEPSVDGSGDPSVAVAVELTEAERAMILAALGEWSGEARVSHDLAIAIGFAGVDEVDEQLDRLIDAVCDAQPLIALDWKRVLLATEICFGSDYFGAGWDWETLTGLDDYASLLALRDIQDKLIAIARQVPPPHHEPLDQDWPARGG